MFRGNVLHERQRDLALLSQADSIALPFGFLKNPELLTKVYAEIVGFLLGEFWSIKLLFGIEKELDASLEEGTANSPPELDELFKRCNALLRAGLRCVDDREDPNDIGYVSFCEIQTNTPLHRE